MTLIELIESLEVGESIKFSQEMFAVRIVVKKGDENAEHKEVSMMVSPREIDRGMPDILGHVANRAIEMVRQ